MARALTFKLREWSSIEGIGYPIHEIANALALPDVNALLLGNEKFYGKFLEIDQADQGRPCLNVGSRAEFAQSHKPGKRRMYFRFIDLAF